MQKDSICFLIQQHLEPFRFHPSIFSHFYVYFMASIIQWIFKSWLFLSNIMKVFKMPTCTDMSDRSHILLKYD